VLLCTHTGCRVVWRDDGAFYQCACHDAHFDAQGVPITGLPNRPLLRVPVAVSGDQAVVGGA
jgi:Rieske Fe-S protein